MAGELLLELRGIALVDDEAVVEEEFFAGGDVVQGVEEDAVADLFGFEVGLAGVVDPLGRVALVLAVDDVAVVEVEVEGVVGLLGVVRVAVECFFPGDDFALVFEHPFACLEGENGIDALAVDAGVTHLGATALTRGRVAVRGGAGGGRGFVRGLRHRPVCLY